MRILLVAAPEDRALFRTAIEGSDLGASIDEASDGASALVSVAKTTYDCLLVGDELPDLRGIAFVMALRERSNHAPVVVVTDRPDEPHLAALVQAGGTDYTWKDDLTPLRLSMRIRFAMRVARAEIETARSVEAAQRSARARDDVLAIVSHDLRGPLHAIGLACEALRSVVTEEATRYIGAIERASHRAERLIKDLLEASAIENGALTLDIRPIDAAAVVRQAAADHELLAKETHGAISTKLPASPLLVSADRDRVLQVLQNLIGNALKHARGTPIELSLTKRDDAAIFSVRDGGPGITETELPHIFDRYWRGRTKRSGGAGLGLAIAKGIVDAHGGHIGVTSQASNGTEFAFTLPLAN